MPYRLIVIALLTCLGCGEVMDRSHLPMAATTLRGSVSLVHPVANAKVCAYDASDRGPARTAFGCGTTDEQGFFSFQAGKARRALVVEAQAPSLALPLATLAIDVPQFGDVDGVAITPITTLTSAYAAFLQAQGTQVEQAIRDAQARVHQHFGGLDHAHIRPWSPPARSDDTPLSLPMLPDVKAYLFAAALEHEARHISRRLNLEPDTAVTVQTLLSSLVEDVSADGVFDGVGLHGAQLTQRDLPLSSETLRGELAAAMLRWANSEYNMTPLREAEVAALVEGLAHGQSPLFPPTAARYDGEHALLETCSVSTERRKTSQLIYPQRGIIELDCHWAEGHTLVDGDIVVSGKSGAGQGAVQGVHLHGNTVSAVIDTRKLDEADPVVGVFGLTVSVENRFGRRTSVQALLEVDNAELGVAITDLGYWVGPNTPFSVQGTSDKPLRSVTLREPGRPDTLVQYDFADKSTQFTLVLPVHDDADHAAELLLEDWSGFVAVRPVFYAACSQLPVLTLFKSAYQHEPRGYGSEPDSTDLGNTTWPIVIHKRYSRFDWLPDEGRTIASQNLPALVFTVASGARGAGAVAGPGVTVDYRVSQMDRSARLRDWETISPDDDGVYRLALAYQTLLPRSIVDAGPGDGARANYMVKSGAPDTYTLTIRLTDEAGNQTQSSYAFTLDLSAPPIVVSQCRVTEDLIQTRLQPPRINTVFKAGLAATERMVSFKPDLPVRSLAPRLSPHVALDKVMAETTIMMARYTEEILTEDDPRVSPGFKLLSRQARNREDRGKLDRFIVWEDGATKQSQASLSDYPVQSKYAVVFRPGLTQRARSEQATIHQAAAIGGAATVGWSDAFALSPDTEYRVATAIRGAVTNPHTAQAIDWRETRVSPDGQSGVLLHERFGNRFDLTKRGLGTMSRASYIVGTDTVYTAQLKMPPVRIHAMSAPDGLPTPTVEYESAACDGSLRVMLYSDGSGVVQPTGAP